MSKIKKNSNIEWVGEIPERWNVEKGKYCLILLDRDVRASDEIITCFRDGEVTLRINRREDGFTISEKEIGYQGVEPGDLVVHGMDGFAGAIGISDSRGKASPVLNVLDSNQNKKYLMYYLRDMAYGDVFVALATGIRVRSCDLRWKKLAELLYTLPPLTEQKAIADFLDKKCCEIDEISKLIGDQIETLENYKKSIITETTSMGLNPNIEMVESGIKWVGSIPKHWNVLKGKYCFKNDKDVVGARVDDFERLALTINGVIMRSKDDNTGLQPEKFNTYQILRKDELVFKLIDLQNVSTSRVGLSPYVGIVSGAYIVLKAKENINPHFAEKYYLSMWMNHIFNYLGDAGVRSSLNADDLLEIELPVPPLTEQKAIADFLDKKCCEIDEIIESKRVQLKKIDEYKKSIIYEYVTGKKEVVYE